MKQSMRRKRSITIGVLCGILCVMAIGYSVFSSRLNIRGTSNISSNWDIEITGIRSGNPLGGDAYDLATPSYTAASATFKTGLVTPWSWEMRTGSYRFYEIEISNLGSIEGMVTIASLNCGNNDAIWCEAIEFNDKYFDEGWNFNNNGQDQISIGVDDDYNYVGTRDYSDLEFTIAPGEKHYLYVGVWYANVDKQPDNLKADISIELNYEQAITLEDGSKVTPPKTYTVTYLPGNFDYEGEHPDIDLIYYR